MDAAVYVKLLAEITIPYASYEMPLVWVFQQYNDLKHTSKTLKKVVHRELN